MRLQEHIRKVLKEETYFKISDDKYSKLIKDAVLDYVNFNNIYFKNFFKRP